MVRSAGRARFAALLLACLGMAAAAADPAFGDGSFAASIQDRILTAQNARKLTCRGELVCGISELPVFYAQRRYEPAWTTPQGPSALADELEQAIVDAQGDGLEPSDYHLDAIRTLVAAARTTAASGQPPDEDLFADLDFLLTDAFLLLSSHLLAGRVNPETLHSEWVVARRPEVDLAQVLQGAIASGGIAAALNGLRPPHPEYKALKSALANYRALRAEGEWPQLPPNAKWDRGQTGEIADLLREHLRRGGDLLPAPEGAPNDADLELFESLKRFQERHGLEADGRLGTKTRQALNVPVADRIRQIELNLERWRWLPHDLGSSFVWVNAAGFQLDVVEDGRTVLHMRVVVGRDYWRTPVFSSRLEYLVFNPDWNIPTRIAVDEILPKVQRDPGILRRENIRVFESWSADAAEVDPLQIDWSQVTAQSFRYRLRKDPGPDNDLGRVKFVFPNKFAVYMHDTKAKNLFALPERSFSHGCIRIEKPIELAQYLLRDAPGWTPEAVVAAIDSGQTRTVWLPTKIPLHLTYFTAGVDKQGRVQFRRDIYQRDPPLDRALRERPPRSPLG